MSAKKGFEVDESTDSGFLSGPIDQLPESLRDEAESAESESKVQEGIDSGLDLCARVAELRVDSETPRLPLTTPELPLALLFRQDDDGDTPLHIASVHGCQRSVATLIRVYQDKYWLDLQNDYGHTALHLAIMCGQAIVARMLVQAGASIAVRDFNGYTAVHAATKLKNVECLQALLARVDHRSQKDLATVLNYKNYEGQTCVHMAASAGHVPSVQTLVYYGADINAREGLAGWTALHIAARKGDLRLAQHIVDKCPGVIPSTRDYAGRSPRRFARRHAALERLLGEDSDEDTDTEDEYDSDEGESLFEKLKSSFTAAPVVTN